MPVPTAPPKGEGGAQPATEEPPLVDDALWMSVTIADLTMPGALYYEYDDDTEQGLFTAQDVAYLKGLFSYNHEPNVAAAESIVKKERTVSTG